MRFAPLVERITGRGANAWELHDLGRRQERETGEPVLFLTVGAPDFDTPKEISERAYEAMLEGDTHYTAIAGVLPLRREIAAWHEKTTGQAVSPDQIVVAAGAQCALFCAMQCLAGAGDEVIVTDPRYSTYEAVVRANGATEVSVPLLPDRGFQIDLEALKAAITPRTRAILLNSPQNPTGAVMDEATMQAVTDLCIEHDLWAVSDEVYAALVFDGAHRSIATLPGMAARTVVINSLSKSHAMTGWRVGWAVGPEDFAQHMATLVLCMLYGSPGFIQQAAVTALRESEVDWMVEAYKRRRDRVAPRLDAAPGLRCPTPAGGMFVMLDVRGSGLSSEDFARQLLKAESVCVLPGDGFGQQSEGFVRISLGLPDAQLDEACARIERFARQRN